ncbi:MAG: hypothetical protein ABR582_17355, partial [Gemmatimonadaceae bacterium]
MSEKRPILAVMVLTLVASCSKSPLIAHRSSLIARSPSLIASGSTLRVCADPDNLPYSNRQRQGFENKIAELVARDFRARVDYTWWPQRRGFVRNTLRAGDCDMIVGVPSNFELAWGTQPYYRSSYVFVSRRDRNLGITSFDDPRLRSLRVGVQMIGNDHVNSPPAHALAKRGAMDNAELKALIEQKLEKANSAPRVSALKAQT